MISDIVLIGPMRAGKSTLGKLLARSLQAPQVSLDDICSDYFKEEGFDWEMGKQAPGRGKFPGWYLYCQSFFPSAVQRVLKEHPHCVIDLGAGHSVYEDAVEFAQVQHALQFHRHIVLVLPSPDLERSASILRERTADVEWLEDFRAEQGFDLNEHFLRHPCNFDLATLIVYTEGKSPEETCDEILARIQQANFQIPPVS